MLLHVTYLSPAKINRYLHIIGRREDGYHLLDTEIQAVSLFDQIHISISEKDDFTTNHPLLKNTSSNLCWKALLLFRKKTEIIQPIHIHLEKRIPLEAGLGGGSGNAATVLWGLNALFNAGLSDDELAEWGLSLGADVPFFFSEGRARCEGIGEKLTHLPFTADSYLIVKPPFGLSTKEVFSQVNPTDYGSAALNSLERPAFLVAPQLAVLKAELYAKGARDVFMTGSGSSIIATGIDSSITIDSIPGCSLYSAQTIKRTQGVWYF